MPFSVTLDMFTRCISIPVSLSNTQDVPIVLISIVIESFSVSKKASVHGFSSPSNSSTTINIKPISAFKQESCTL